MGSLKPGDYSAELKVDGLSIKFRPLTYKEANQGNTAQIEMQRVLNNLATLQDEEQRTKASSDGLKKISKISMEIVANTVESITLPDGIKVQEKK